MFGLDDMAGAALIGGAANLAGDLWSQSNARDAFKHRYQDTVADMKAAGLNPALAYGQGGGSPQTMPAGDWGSSAAGAAQAIANANKTKAETDLLKAQTADLVLRPKLENLYLNAGIENRKSGTDVNTARAGLLNLDLGIGKETRASDIEARKAYNAAIIAGVPEAKARARYFQQTGVASFYLNNATEIAKTAAQIYGARGLNKPRNNSYYITPRYR